MPDFTKPVDFAKGVVRIDGFTEPADSAWLARNFLVKNGRLESFGIEAPTTTPEMFLQFSLEEQLEHVSRVAAGIDSDFAHDPLFRTIVFATAGERICLATTYWNILFSNGKRTRIRNKNTEFACVGWWDYELEWVPAQNQTWIRRYDVYSKVPDLNLAVGGYHLRAVRGLDVSGLVLVRTANGSPAFIRAYDQDLNHVWTHTLPDHAVDAVVTSGPTRYVVVIYPMGFDTRLRTIDMSGNLIAEIALPGSAHSYTPGFGGYDKVVVLNVGKVKCYTPNLQLKWEEFFQKDTLHDGLVETVIVYVSTKKGRIIALKDEGTSAKIQAETQTTTITTSLATPGERLSTDELKKGRQISERSVASIAPVFAKARVIAGFVRYLIDLEETELKLYGPEVLLL